jgi:phage terminase large subunit-like protein
MAAEHCGQANQRSCLSELLRFPAGKYDDGVDVCSLIRRGLDFARSWDRAATEESPRIGVVGVVRAFRLGDDGWMAM